MISHEHKCIFIHIPKTAGTSIEKKLGHFTTLKREVQDHTYVKDIEPLSLADLISIALSGRIKYVAKELRNQLTGKSQRLTKEQFDSYYKFAFVRNSWSRVFSWYQNVMRDPLHQEENNVKPDVSFEYFVKHHLNGYLIQSQMVWLKNNKGQLPFDFIGRFETLNQDFSHVCQVLKLDDAELPKLVTGTHSSSSYVDEYTDETRKIVADHFAEEIEYFKFEFGQ